MRSFHRLSMGEIQRANKSKGLEKLGRKTGDAARFSEAKLGNASENPGASPVLGKGRDITLPWLAVSLSFSCLEQRIVSHLRYIITKLQRIRRDARKTRTIP